LGEHRFSSKWANVFAGIIRLSVFLAPNFAAALFLTSNFAAAQSEWLTWGHDQQRTGWNPSEKVLTKDTVSRLELKWKTQLPTAAREEVLSTVTAPLVANVNGPRGQVTRVFVAGSDNSVYAIDAGTGEIVWQRRFPNTLTAPAPPDYRCPNTQNATPVIDKAEGTIYISMSDGKLRGLNLVDGEDRMPPANFTAPFARNWSLNLIDGVVYSPTARGCADTPTRFTALDLKDPGRRTLDFFTSAGVPPDSRNREDPSGAWGRGGLVLGPKGIYAQTADGPYDPASGQFGETVVAVSLKTFRLVDSYTPANWEYLNRKDLDMGSVSPVIFPFEKWTLLASVGKESAIALLDANNLGGADHHTPLHLSPRWGNDEEMLHDRGVWGSMATWQDDQGQRWLLMPMQGPPAKDAPKFRTSYGDAQQGSIMAFQVLTDRNSGKPTLEPAWISRNMHAPDPPVVANGVVYALQTGKNATETRSAGKQPGTNAVLYALDAETGRQLYSSEKLIDSFTHFSEPVVAAGKIYVSTWDGKVYAFGLN
jgi:outer membrane protein assembly factor BamB